MPSHARPSGSRQLTVTALFDTALGGDILIPSAVIRHRRHPLVGTTPQIPVRSSRVRRFALLARCRSRCWRGASRRCGQIQPGGSFQGRGGPYTLRALHALLPGAWAAVPAARVRRPRGEAAAVITRLAACVLAGSAFSSSCPSAPSRPSRQHGSGASACRPGGPPAGSWFGPVLDQAVESGGAREDSQEPRDTGSRGRRRAGEAKRRSCHRILSRLG